MSSILAITVRFLTGFRVVTKMPAVTVATEVSCY